MDRKEPHLPCACTRRDFLFNAGAGFGSLALACLLAQETGANPQSAIRNPYLVNPLAPKEPHFKPRATSVIFLFMVGGPSHVETFDPKPQLDKMSGQPLPPSFGVIKSQFINGGTPLLGSAWKFHKRGKSGIEVSELV